MTAKFPFYKIQGCGNDFIVCFAADLPPGFESSARNISVLCDRHFGIGSDGLMIVGDPSVQPVDVSMFNPDGSAMGMCGNGIRCVLRFLYLNNQSLSSSAQFRFNVSRRIIVCSTEDSGQNVVVDMGPPSFPLESLSGGSGDRISGAQINVSGQLVEGWAVSMGNPHFVIFTDQIDDKSVCELGAMIERHQLFPDRTNVEFVKVLSARHIVVKVWERGAGYTLACGSGACAAVVAGIVRGVLQTSCLVELPGGNLDVNWDSTQKNASVFLKGPAAEVFFGNWIDGRISKG